MPRKLRKSAVQKAQKAPALGSQAAQHLPWPLSPTAGYGFQVLCWLRCRACAPPSKKAWWRRGLGKVRCEAVRLIWACAELKGGASRGFAGHPTLLAPAASHATPIPGSHCRKTWFLLTLG